MPKPVLDTNILIAHFQKFRPFDGKSPLDAEEWAKVLIADKETNAIVSPVEVEFLCGVLNQTETVLREGYLRAFRLIDDRKTLPADWEEARRVAKHPGFHAGPRDLGDCVIAAISERLHCAVISDDKGLSRQLGRTRLRRP